MGDTFEVGDSVILNEDEDFVREQFRIFDNSQIVWTEGLAKPMLGKTFEVQGFFNDDTNWVGLPSNDEYGTTWYFPKTTLRLGNCNHDCNKSSSMNRNISPII